MRKNQTIECRRVVITGIGLLTPLGIGTQESWNGVVNGVSGAAEFTQIDHAGFSVHFGCEVKGFDPTHWIEPREARRLDRFTQFAVASARLAVADARLQPDALDKSRCGVVYASGIGGIRSIEEHLLRYVAKGPSRISPFSIPMLMVNAASGQIAIGFGFTGPNYAPVSACSSGNHAIGLAFRHIRHGEADLIISGGSEAAIGIMGLGGFANMHALSTRNNDPQRASRPFDKNRDGFVMGEGAGALVLEELGHAQARGATIIAEVLGCGFTDDATHITAPAEGGEGLARAITLALQDGDIPPHMVDYINAHGTSTVFNDRAETAAIKRALGEENARRCAISSTKGCTGHLLGATSAVELGFTALAVAHGMIPPTINYETPDPECDLNYTPNLAQRRELRYALSNSCGFGGHNTCLALGRYDS